MSWGQFWKYRENESILSQCFKEVLFFWKVCINILKLYDYRTTWLYTFDFSHILKALPSPVSHTSTFYGFSLFFTGFYFCKRLACLMPLAYTIDFGVPRSSTLCFWVFLLSILSNHLDHFSYCLHLLSTSDDFQIYFYQLDMTLIYLTVIGHLLLNLSHQLHSKQFINLLL